MTKEQLAERLNGREYRSEVFADDIKDAQENGLLIIYGASDDICIFDGVISEEIDCYEGGNIEFTLEHGVKNAEEDEVLQKYGHGKKYNKLQILWCKEGDYSWTYATAIPHATFEVVEDGEPYCRGIVIDSTDLV